MPVVLKVMKPNFINWSGDWLRHFREAIFLQNIERWENDFIKEFGHEWIDEFGDKRSFYYVHAYAAFPTKKENLLSYVEHYNQRIAAAICEGNIIGVQFHPERSGEFGLGFIEKFMNL